MSQELGIQQQRNRLNLSNALRESQDSAIAEQKKHVKP